MKKQRYQRKNCSRFPQHFLAKIGHLLLIDYRPWTMEVSGIGRWQSAIGNQPSALNHKQKTINNVTLTLPKGSTLKK
ncbi:MAG: hypothetical protein LPK45_10820 [Bacteroidota bacterium]|nr:hypothetical protein [Bacteroidota bacterium]